MVAADTTVALIRHIGSGRRGPSGVRMRLMTGQATRLIYKCIEAAFGVGIYRKHLIRQLKGVPRSDLYAAAAEVSNQLMEFSSQDPVIRFIQERRWSKQIILSASVEPIVTCLASLHGMESLSSELSYESGLCTGVLARDLLGKKHTIAAQMREMGFDLTKATVVTDNVDDELLCALAWEYRFVSRRASKQNPHWVDPEFVINV